MGTLVCGLTFMACLSILCVIEEALQITIKRVGGLTFVSIGRYRIQYSKKRI